MIKYILIFIFITFNVFGFDAFINPNELRANIEDKNLIIIDVDSYALYKKSHIKHAIYFDIQKLIPREENPYMLLDSAQNVQSTLKGLGINTNSKVVLYAHNTTQGTLNSSYLAFALIYNGFENVTILNGGYMAWVFQNDLLISSEKFSPEDDGNFTFKANPNLLVDLEYLKQNPQNATILDARPIKQYYGIEKTNKIDGIGHIPHAKSAFYKYSFLSDETIRKDDELNEIYIDGDNLSQESNIITYGNSVYDASMLWYILYQKMGFKHTKLYGASLKEWGNNHAMPMQRFKWE